MIVILIVMVVLVVVCKQLKPELAPPSSYYKFFVDLERLHFANLSIQNNPNLDFITF